MAHLNTQYVLTDYLLNKFKVIQTINVVGQSALLEVYKQIKLFPDTKSIKDHLIQDLGWSISKYKSNFDKTMREKIDNTEKTGEKYDVSLLAKCLRVLSQQYDPNNQSNWTNELELEGRCKKLKDMRNDIFHSIIGLTNREMMRDINAIKQVVMEIMSSLEHQFSYLSREIRVIEASMDNQISDIITQPLGKSEIQSILLEKARLDINNEKPQYKDRSKSWGNLKILDFLLGCSTLHNVKLLFTDVIVEKSMKFKENTKINCADIFKLASDTSILLIESEAGGGKTTIFRFGINDWGDGGNVMNTENYDFIFPMVFRNPHLRSVSDLLEDLIPNPCNKNEMKYIMQCMKEPSQKILFFCDGYDEKNENSHHLFKEICELKRKFPNIKLIVTSRPQSVRELYYSFGTDHPIDHLKVLGIHESKRGEFLRKYHDELIAAGLSNQTTQSLLDFYQSCSARHKELYRLPMNLVILAWLWGQDTDKAKTIKTGAGLYTAIIDILNKKLLTRIMQCHPDVMNNLKGDVDRLIELIDRFKQRMYNESFNAVRYDRIYIEDTGVKKLRYFCEDNSLPFSEMKGAYLLSKLEWENVNDLKEILELPHKGFLDYYTAKCIESRLHHITNDDEDKSVIKSRKEVIKGRNSTGNSNKNNIDNNLQISKENLIGKIIIDSHGKDFDRSELVKYQNILLLLGGILALKDPNLIEEYGHDIIDLLITMGVRNNSQWYDVYSDCSVNPASASKFGQLIAPLLNCEGFTIKDSDVDILSTLIQYVHVNEATLDINSTTMPVSLPSLLSNLNAKQCELSIKQITEGQVQLWNNAIVPNKETKIKHVTLNISCTSIPGELTSLIDVFRIMACNITIPEIFDEQVDLWMSCINNFTKITTKDVTIRKSHNSLQFLSYFKKIDKLCLQHLWRYNHTNPAPYMSRLEVKSLWTAVDSAASLPTSVEYLRLALLIDTETGAYLDPGISELKAQCQQLRDLGLHIRAGTATEHLSPLPDGVRNLWLYLSDLNDEKDIQWAVQTAKTVQPLRSFFWRLVLPRCCLQPKQLTKLLQLLEAEGITIVLREGSGPHIIPGSQEHMQLIAATSYGLEIPFSWKETEEELDHW